MPENDELLFAEETQAETETPPEEDNEWKLLIADDEEEVHAVTRMVLDGFTFEQRGLQLIGAYSGEETKTLLKKHPDTAVLLLDVVMEEDTTGLEVVKYVRDVIKNHLVRIILRTGQPGQAPERRVTMEYDINDYKEKTELTAQKLFTTVLASLRAYRDLKKIERNQKGLEKVVKASTSLSEFRALQPFATGAVTYLLHLIHAEEKLRANSSGFVANILEGNGKILAGVGVFEPYIDYQMKELPVKNIHIHLEKAIHQKQSLFFDNGYVGYFATRQGDEFLMYVQHSQPLSDIDRQLIEIFATNIAVGFENIALNQEIEETQKDVILTLGEVVETRSQETGYHVKRVGEYSYLLGVKYGLNEEQAILLRLAAPMHDVGKIGIPDAILNKPGKLTAKEFEEVKTHTTIGYNILKTSKQPIMSAAATIALQHHERWDGEGYPHGLQGEAVHIFARIAKIADVFDALSCRRVYKEAWDLESILAVFQQEKGKNFDPALVNIFLEHIEEFVKIYKMFPDEV